MMPTTKTIITITILLLGIGISSARAKDKSIDIKSLQGDWEGVGQFLVPVTNFNVDINGHATFTWIPDGNYLRTSLKGDKLFFTYSDSGHLVHDQATDSISWEVWDNTGHYAKYFGEATSNGIEGSRTYKKDLYQVLIQMITADSIDFKLRVTPPKGDPYNKATFTLWRVKE